MGLKVCKFGGTSLASAPQIRKVCDILLADPDRRMAALSAPGKRGSGDTKVTDLLIACAQEALRGDEGAAQVAAERVASRFIEIADGLDVDDAVVEDLRAGLRGRLSAPKQDAARFTDGLKALGEEHCARLVAHFLAGRGVKARYVDPRDGMVLSDEAGNARVLPETYDRLAKLREAPGIVLYPGFFGYSPSGALVTFPRGGTDITGAILAAAVGADLYENFTDVDSVYSAHPGMVEKPAPIKEMTYSEMRELSYAGFEVFHDEALEPVFRANIPVRIANTNNPEAPGTRLVPRRQARGNAVAGIAASLGFCSIYVSKYLMNRERGFGRRLLQIVEEAGLSYEHSPSGIDTISVILKAGKFDPAIEKTVLDRIKAELKPDNVSLVRGQALVMVVGENMRRTVGVAARATGALGAAGVNIEMMNQGASEISMMFGVKSDDVRTAVNALYDEFFRITSGSTRLLPPQEPAAKAAKTPKTAAPKTAKKPAARPSAAKKRMQRGG